MPKVNLRRSNRDRHPVYQSLQENSLGIPLESALFSSLVREANHHRSRDPYFRPRCHTRSRRAVGSEDEELYPVTPRSGEVSEAEQQNDENVPHTLRSKRQCVARRQAFAAYADEDDDDDVYEAVKTRRTSRAYKNRRNQRTSQATSELNSTLNDSQVGEEDLSFYASPSERVKRRRGGNEEHNESPPSKRQYAEENGSEPTEDAVKNGKKVKTAKTEAEDAEDGQEPEERESGSADVDEPPEEEEVDDGRRYHLRNRDRIKRLQDQFVVDQRLRRSTRVSTHIQYNDHRSRRRSQARHERKTKRYRGRSSSSSSTSLSSSDNDLAVKDLRAEARFERRKLKSLEKGRAKFLPVNMNTVDWKNKRDLNNLVGQHTAIQGPGDLDPMVVDSHTGFEDVGGLDSHVQSLKEIVAFPLLYPELFQNFNITPPKGVLFYGPPGTGKTLVARALANECSKNGKKVAFFMRKGADCMSKWIGESERHLRTLFDQAYQMRPSIIFFDEIDGLAPVRSSRQDQIHSSIVSTLLALMDGLDSRGQVVVIGATNRVDSIDPALRRPGRFDRELRFDLPDRFARRKILEIHTKDWETGKPSTELLDRLSEQTSGYCGADLKALCTEGVLVAIRQRYPHIYVTNDKLELDTAAVKVAESHFDEAMRRIVPASRRGLTATSFLSNSRCKVFVDLFVAKVLNDLPAGYVNRQPPTNSDELQRVIQALKMPPVVPSARILITGDGEIGQYRYYLNALAGHLDHLPIFSLSYGQLFSSGAEPEENLSSVITAISQATARGSACLLLLPDIDIMESAIPPSLYHMLITGLQRFCSFTPLLIIGTIRSTYENATASVKELFNARDCLLVKKPSKDLRRSYFSQIFEEAKLPPITFNAADFPAPPKAKQPSDDAALNLTEPELKNLEKNYEQMLRQHRIFLRDILGRLIRDRRFNAFNLPVSTDEVEDYYEIIANPMCLSDIMKKIDEKQYQTSSAFLADIELIRDNALEYNPCSKFGDMIIRHNANSLVDAAAGLFDAELDENWEKKLLETANIIEATKKRLAEKSAEQQKASASPPSTQRNGAATSTQSSRKSSASSASKEPVEEEALVDALPAKTLILNTDELSAILDLIVQRTKNWRISDLESLGVQLLQVIQSFSDEWDRSQLSSLLEKKANAFELD